MKDAFAKKFLVPGEIPLAARSHRIVSGTVLQGGQELATSIQNVSSRSLIFQDFSPRSVPNRHLQGALRTKRFSPRPCSRLTDGVLHPPPHPPRSSCLRAAVLPLSVISFSLAGRGLPSLPALRVRCPQTANESVSLSRTSPANARRFSPAMKLSASTPASGCSR